MDAVARLPAIRAWAEGIRKIKSGRQRVAVSADFLTRHRQDLKNFASVDDLALSADPELAPSGATKEEINTAKALVHHILEVRAPLARELWSRQIFIATEILDDLIFYAVRDGTDPDPIYAVLARIRDARVNRPGFLVFPVHSLGVTAGGLLLPFGRAFVSFVSERRGYVLSPQTNSFDRSLALLDGARDAFGIKKRIPVELIKHWRRSRNTEWLERNPLLIVRTIQWPGSYYGNEWLLLSRIRTTAATLSMLASLQPVDEERAGRLFSSVVVNNWQTLDIHHYFALYDWPNRKNELDGQCVPIHAGRVAVAELSNLAIEVDPRYWRQNDATGDRVHDAMENLYAAYLRQRFAHGPDNAISRTVRRFFESVDYFRRSFQRSENDFTGTVSLSTAFEMLLTDHYGAVKSTLTKRVALLLHDQHDCADMQDSVGDLYDRRSEMVHGGSRDTVPDLALARQAYTLCLVSLVERIGMLSARSSTPVKDLCGDTTASHQDA
jgi:hypothetical protein